LVGLVKKSKQKLNANKHDAWIAEAQAYANNAPVPVMEPVVAPMAFAGFGR